jgi:hypothetical protein
MNLCSCCEGIVQALSCRPHFPLTKNDHWGNTVHTRTTKLSVSARSCCLCGMIKDYILKYGRNGNVWNQWQRPGEFRVCLCRSTSGTNVLAALILPDNKFSLRIGLWTEKGKIVRTQVVDSQPIMKLICIKVALRLWTML